MTDETHLTVGEFRARMDGLQREVTSGFARVNGRLERHSEAITEHGKAIERHDVRLDTVEAQPSSRQDVITIPLTGRAITALLLALAAVVAALAKGVL